MLTGPEGDILQFQRRGADILVSGDINAWTAEHDDLSKAFRTLIMLGCAG